MGQLMQNPKSGKCFWDPYEGSLRARFLIVGRIFKNSWPEISKNHSFDGKGPKKVKITKKSTKKKIKTGSDVDKNFRKFFCISNLPQRTQKNFGFAIYLKKSVPKKFLYPKVT